MFSHLSLNVLIFFLQNRREDRRNKHYKDDGHIYDNAHFQEFGDVYRPDYRHTDYFHKNIPTMWEHKHVLRPKYFDYPGHYFWGPNKSGSNEYLQGSTSSESISTPRRNVIVAVMIVLGLLIFLGGVIAVIVYFTSFCKYR